MAHKQTIIGIAVHPPGDSPVYGEAATHVLLDDEAAGPFILLRQAHDGIKPGEVRLDPEELDAVYDAAKRLIKGERDADR